MEKLRPVGLVLIVTLTIAGVGVGVGLDVGVAATAEGLPSMIRPHAAAAKHAIVMRRLIPSIKAWRSCLTGSCSLEEDKGPSCMDDIRCKLLSPWRRNAIKNPPPATVRSYNATITARRSSEKCK